MPLSLGSRLTRRSLVQGAAGAAGALGLGAGILGTAPGALAAPSASNPVTTVSFLPWWVYWTPAGKTLLAEACAEFASEPGHKGLRAVALPGPQGGATSTGNVITAILSGTGPDVIADCCSAWVEYLGVSAFENLTPYLQRDNIPLATWSAGHMQALATPSGQFGLPVYDGPMVFVYRQDIFDSLGLAYPSPEWTWQEAATLWRQLSGTMPGAGHTRRYGAAISNWFPSLLRGFGGAEMDASHTKSLLGDPGSITGGEWLMNLIWDNVVTTSADTGYTSTDWFVTGQSPMMMRGGWNVHADATNFGTRFPWNYLPVPKYPEGRATFANNDFWGMNAASPHKEAAWELLKWLTYEDYWQEFVMKTTLLEPCKLSLWDKWESYWQQAAPIFRTKDIKWYRDAALGGYGYAEQFFKYQASQAENIENNMLTELAAQKIDVVAGFTQAAAQINALETVGAASEARQQVQEATIMGEITRVKPGPRVQYSTPAPVQGAGVPPSSADSWVVQGPAGQYTLLGDGWDVWATSDNAVFACLPVTATEGEWTCRVTGITNLTCKSATGPALSVWAKVGLMAAGDLSDDPPYCSPHVTGANQIEWQARIMPGLYPSGAAGLLPQGVQNLTSPVTKPAANFLLKPVWLRLRRVGDEWTPFASMNGAQWTQLSPPTLVRMAACWVGIFACAHNADFGNQGYIRATLDNLSFRPARFVQLGNTGTPPAAGAVPKNWATMTPAGL